MTWSLFYISETLIWLKKQLQLWMCHICNIMLYQLLMFKYIRLLFAQVCCVLIPFNPSFLGLDSLSIQSIQEVYCLLRLHVSKMLGVRKRSYQTCWEIPVNNWSTIAVSVDILVSVDCIESEWTASPVFFFSSSSLPLLPRPHPPQRILCSTSALAMFEPGLGSCCRLDWGERGMEGWKRGRKEGRRE